MARVTFSPPQPPKNPYNCCDGLTSTISALFDAQLFSWFRYKTPLARRAEEENKSNDGVDF